VVSNNDIIYALGQGKDGMKVYLRCNNGDKMFLLHHRVNPDLYSFLRYGTSVANIYRYKPGRNVREQKLYSSLRYIVKVAKWVQAYELAA
jgi:hypothetical protein